MRLHPQRLHGLPYDCWFQRCETSLCNADPDHALGDWQMISRRWNQHADTRHLQSMSVAPCLHVPHTAESGAVITAWQTRLEKVLHCKSLWVMRRWGGVGGGEEGGGERRGGGEEGGGLGWGNS